MLGGILLPGHGPATSSRDQAGEGHAVRAFAAQLSGYLCARNASVSPTSAIFFWRVGRRADIGRTVIWVAMTGGAYPTYTYLLLWFGNSALLTAHPVPAQRSAVGLDCLVGGAAALTPRTGSPACFRLACRHASRRRASHIAQPSMPPSKHFIPAPPAALFCIGCYCLLTCSPAPTYLPYRRARHMLRLPHHTPSLHSGSVHAARAHFYRVRFHSALPATCLPACAFRLTATLFCLRLRPLHARLLRRC